MTIQEKFLGLYKEYETLVRASGKEPKELEDAVVGVESDRLKLCRQFRNYFAHVQDPGFLVPTEKMMVFLKARVDEMKAAGDVAKKHLKKPDYCMLTEEDKISDAYAMFSKLCRSDILVLKKDNTYGLLSVYSVIGAEPRARVSLFKITKVKPVFCGPLDAYETLDLDKVVLCTDDGTPDGKLLGRVWK